MIAIETLKVIDDAFVEASISSTEATDTITLEAEVAWPGSPLHVHQVYWTSTRQCALEEFSKHEGAIRKLLSARL